VCEARYWVRLRARPSQAPSPQMRGSRAGELWMHGARRSPKTLFDAPLDARAEELPLMLDVSPERGAVFTPELNSVYRGKYADSDGQEQKVPHGLPIGAVGSWAKLWGDP
jgi:hypothetical protein